MTDPQVTEPRMHWRNIGDDVTIAEYGYHHDIVAGILWRHACPDDPRGPAAGGDAVPFAPLDPHGWTVEARTPLTLTESIACRDCGRHGFIRGGRWVQA